jgi:hypothetical protein
MFQRGLCALSRCRLLDTRGMAAPPNAGRQMEVVFTEHDRVLEVETDDPDGDHVVETLVAALGSDDADDAERRLQAGLGHGRVERRSGRSVRRSKPQR